MELITRQEVKEVIAQLHKLSAQMMLVNQKLDRVVELSERHHVELFGNGEKVGLDERVRDLEASGRVIKGGMVAALLSFLSALGAWVFDNFIR